MQVIENRCCGCATESYPCRGKSCDLRNYIASYCDECKEEKEIHNYDDEELCVDCIQKRINLSEYDEVEN